MLLLESLVFYGVLVVALCIQTSRNPAIQGTARWVRAHSSWLALLLLILLSMSTVELMVGDWSTVGLVCACIMTAGRHMADLQFHSKRFRIPEVDVDKAAMSELHDVEMYVVLLVVVLVS